ncbi:MAG: hypothetical protein KDE50_34005 [Caldilineaceae bacterium]|nr:hypothetical protein [Caldilineaceae bacterium]MCB0127213.1 hypothetical protein [Caldilineaceae bacterium]MCB0144947.1 hypothetical protein [Caldilineaceae bacterium]
MRIEIYFQHIQDEIDASPMVDMSTIRFERRGESLGFIRGELLLIDGSILHVREFVDATGTEIVRETYAYHYMNATPSFVFRYDNVDHHKKLNLSSHPHHKHDGGEQNIIASTAPTLADVLEEIGLLIRLE